MSSEPLLPVYLLAGSDRPKVARALRRLRSRFGDESIEHLAADTADGAEAVAACNALGLFAGDEGGRLVIVEGVERWKKADVEAVHGFGEAVKQAGKSSPDKQGMWANSNFDDLVQYNDGFKTGMVGTPEQIAEKNVALKEIGVNLVLGGFLHFHEEIEFFGQRVLPLVRELENAKPRLLATA